jgi:GAF domain-containing protein
MAITAMDLDAIPGGLAPPIPANEAARLETLAAHERAGATQRTQDLDRIARLAATFNGAPIGLVTLIGRDTQQFIGKFGLDGVDGTSRDASFCGHTILGQDTLVVDDTTRDARFADNPLVTGNPGIRYYAGAPIISPRTGHALGAVCVIDTVAHDDTSESERALLTDLANMAGALLEALAAVG